MYLGYSYNSRQRLTVGFLFLIATGFISPAYARSARCHAIFELQDTPIEVTFTDHRDHYHQNAQNGFFKIDEGNSGRIYLFKNEKGEFKVAKFYKAERAANLERDHLGLKEVQTLFDNDRLHSLQFRVARSEIRDGFSSVWGSRALVMDYHPGFNLHKLLISTPKNHPLHVQAATLYQKLVKELDREAHLLGLRDEVRPETDKYFNDHIVDGLPMLFIEGRPRLLIKTDNIIFNPIENTLTLIDPY